MVPSLGGGSATGFGGLAIRNDVESGATAKINAADVDSVGDVTVSAIQSGTIKADAKARVETTGSSKGTSLAINGVIATNNVRGYAKATIDGSDVAATSAAGDTDGSDLIVTADSTLAINATIDAETISKQKAAGITLAFNTVGIAGQNFLFNAIDTLVGTDLVGTIYGHDPNASVAATITGSKIDVSGDATVQATADQTINSKITNYVRTLRGGEAATSVGGVFALNRVKVTIAASVDSATALQTIDVAGDLLVSALNETEITSHVVAPVIAVDYNYQSQDAKAFSIGLVAARNVADATVSASIDDVADLDAGSVTVEAGQKGKIDATAAAAAVSVAIGKQGAQSISGAGVVAFNTILGDVKAVILDSDVSAPAGEVSVKAENTADIDAVTAAAAGSVSASFTAGGNAFAIGLALAFNHIGFAGSAATPGPATSLKTEAAIRNSGAAGNKVSVKALSDANIDAKSLVASVAIGASKRGGWSAAAGGVSAVNKIATSTTAVIEETDTGRRGDLGRRGRRRPQRLRGKSLRYPFDSRGRGRCGQFLGQGLGRRRHRRVGRHQ